METKLYGFLVFVNPLVPNALFLYPFSGDREKAHWGEMGYGKWEQFLFMHNTKKSAVSWVSTTLPRITEKTNQIKISLTGTHCCNSKLFNKRDIPLLFLIFQKSLQKNHGLNGRVSEGFCVCFENCLWKTSMVKPNYLFFILDFFLAKMSWTS